MGRSSFRRSSLTRYDRPMLTQTEKGTHLFRSLHTSASEPSSFPIRGTSEPRGYWRTWSLRR